MVAPRRRDAAIEHLDFAIAEFQDMETQPALERALGRKGLLGKRRGSFLVSAGRARTRQGKPIRQVMLLSLPRLTP